MRVRVLAISSLGTAVIAAVSSSSCGFSPQIADGAFACADDGTCPPGQTCASDRRCYAPGAGPGGGEDGGSSGGPGGGDGGTEDLTVGPFDVGGTVSGLTGKGLVLEDVGTDDLEIAMDGAFVFGTKLPTGALYNVTVSSQPSEPTQVCGVTNGSGRIAGASVGNVTVACATATFSIGGVVVGLGNKDGLKLTNNGADEISVAANATGFVFPTKIASGAMFAVAVSNPPTGGNCNVSGGTGTVGVTDVTGVVVNCDPTKFTVGGTVTGLVGSVVLHENTTGVDLAVSANGSFAFPTPITTSTEYTVIVKKDPTYAPREQTCTVTNGTGTMGTANVTDIAVTCTTKTFTIGGSVTGLSGMVTLKDNGGDDLRVSASGPFTFKTAVASGDTYKVTVSKQPSGQVCTVASNTGTVTNANITNVSVACATSDPGILCGSVYCDASTQVCCPKGADGKSPPACQSRTGITCKAYYQCDDMADCAATAGTICCGVLDGKSVDNLKSTSCTSQASCTGAIICDPKTATECTKGQQCKTGGVLATPSFVAASYGACQ